MNYALKRVGVRKWAINRDPGQATPRVSSFGSGSCVDSGEELCSKKENLFHLLLSFTV